MRPLHRPMFRYGGPIKEGVMSGIRESHAGGGRAALVGNPMFPQHGGRALHAEQLSFWPKIVDAGKKTLTSASKKPLSVFSPGKKWKAIKNIGLTGARPVQNWYKKWRSSLDMPKSRISSGSGMGGVNLTEAQIAAGMGTKPAGFFNKAWQFAKLNPKTTAAGAYIGSPAVVGGLTSIPYKKAGMQILDLAVPDFIFDQDKYFADKEKDKLDEEKALTANELRIKELEKLLAGKEEPAVPQKTEEEIRNERIQKYRDIMDIKGMNKRAAYDSLIDASKLISESGDFKGDVKSGKLINEVIQATSKQFDKPSKTKDAIDTLILKGEIEKDIKSTMPTEAEKTAAAFGISKDEYKKKLLGKDSAAQIIASISTKTGRVDSTTVASGYKASGIVPKATITDTIVDEWIDDKDGRTEIDYVKEVISKADGFGPGLYVVGDRAVLFDGTNYQYDY